MYTPPAAGAGFVGRYPQVGRVVELVAMDLLRTLRQCTATLKTVLPMIVVQWCVTIASIEA